jgi:hypothetical protein
MIDDSKSVSFIGLCGLTKQSTRERILAYEEEAKKLPQIEIPVKHYIHGGMYAREITIPKGTLITGMIYKFDHFDIMVSGDITVTTDSGEPKRLTGYNCFKGQSGKKRAGYANEDTVWITLHPFGSEVSSDGEEIQEFLTAKTFEDLNEFYRLLNIADYKAMLNEIDMTEEEIRLQVDNDYDMVEMPIGYENILIKPSNIQGQGLFSAIKLFKGCAIGPARINGLRTPMGKYANHAVNPNAKIVIKNNDAEVVAIKDIEAGEEITVNYRSVITERFDKGELCQE